MAHVNWAVEYPADPSAAASGRLPVGAKLLSSLLAALVDAPIDDWAFEVGGEPVDSYEAFQERLDAATDVGEGEFIARTGGIVVRSI